MNKEPEIQVYLINNFQSVMTIAENEAREVLQHEYLGTEHILLALIRWHFNLFPKKIAQKADLSYTKAKEGIISLVQIGPEKVFGRLPRTPRAKKVILYAGDEVERLGGLVVNPVHLLLGIAREVEGMAAEVLRRMGINLDQLREDILENLSQQRQSLAKT